MKQLTCIKTRWLDGGGEGCETKVRLTSLRLLLLFSFLSTAPIWASPLKTNTKTGNARGFEPNWSYTIIAIQSLLPTTTLISFRLAENTYGINIIICTQLRTLDATNSFFLYFYLATDPIPSEC